MQLCSAGVLLHGKGRVESPGGLDHGQPARGSRFHLVRPVHAPAGLMKPQATLRLVAATPWIVRTEDGAVCKQQPPASETRASMRASGSS